MPYQLQIMPHVLHFRQPAGTSRGVYTERNVWYLRLTHSEQPDRIGLGECAPLPALSCDDYPDYEAQLRRFIGQIELKDDAVTKSFLAAGADFDALAALLPEALRSSPSMLFGLETAFRHFATGSFALWDSPFSRGEAGIPINGLIWMGDYDAMLRQVETKMKQGYRCIKLKIGAIDFEEELQLIAHVRRHFSKQEIELRVDANGAFAPDSALEKLERLAALDLHSIEQPVAAGQWDVMAHLCAVSPLPVALDEELIGIHHEAAKKKLLQTIRPQYIVLKPSLHGGFSGSSEWIRLAEAEKTGWWITSALESNIGLNAIAQWCATLQNKMPQGLGTGALFTDNVPMPLSIRRDCLWFDPAARTDAAYCLNFEL